MNKNYLIPLLFFLLAGTVLLSAEDVLVLTEQDAVDMAVGRNLSLQSARLDVESSEEAVKNSWNVVLPTFSASAGVSRSGAVFTDPLPTASDTWGVNTSLSAELGLNATALFSIEGAKLSDQTRHLSYEMEQTMLIINVKKQFNYLVANKENLALQEKNLELAEKRYEQTLVNYENGLASELSVLEARNSYESMRPAYTNTKTAYETQLMAFRKMLSIDLEQEVDVEGFMEFSPLDLDAKKLIDTFMMNRFDIQLAIKTMDVDENILSMTKTGSLTPSLILSGSWSSNAADAGDPDWIDSASVSAMVSLPLNGFIPGSSENLDIRDAERSIEKARLSLEDTIEGAEQDIRSLLMELDGYRENMEITGLSVELARKTYEMTEEAYRLGTREILDVEDAQNKLLSANQDLLSSRYSYLSGLLDLEYALNASLDEIRAVKL